MNLDLIQSIFENLITLNLSLVQSVLFCLTVIALILIFMYFKKKYKEDIFFMFKNIFVLYKNFWHWNLSKITIFLYCAFSWLLLSSPFLALCIYWTRNFMEIVKPGALELFFQTWELNVSLLTSFIENIWLVIWILFSLLVTLTIFILVFMYGNILIQNVYRNYLNWEKLPIFQNWFLSWARINKYLSLIWWTSLYFLIPIGILFLGFIVLVIISYFWLTDIIKWFNYWETILWAITFLVIFWNIIYFLLLSMKLSFSFMEFVFTENVNVNVKLYIKESFNISNWNILKIISLLIPFSMISTLILSLFSFFQSDYNFVNILMTVIYFIAFWFVNFMVYISIFLILKKDRWLNINKIINIQKEIELKADTDNL